MPSLREIRLKIKSVRQTQKVTKAMKMIAAARLKKAQAALLSARPYAYKVEELIRNIKGRLEGEGRRLPELFKARPQALDKAAVIFTSDRGLCGSYNVSLLRMALDYCKQVALQGGKVHFFVVGKKGRDFLISHGFKVVREYVHFMRSPSFSQAEILGKELMAYYKENPIIGEVVALFTDFKSLLRQLPALEPLLPPPAKKISHSDSQTSRPTLEATFDFIYEPNRETILEALIWRYVNTQISRMMFEAYTSEQASRMNVMENATRNAGELIEGLTLLGNKVRQSSITREILEVVSGAEALGVATP